MFVHWLKWSSRDGVHDAEERGDTFWSKLSDLNEWDPDHRGEAGFGYKQAHLPLNSIKKSRNRCLRGRGVGELMMKNKKFLSAPIFYIK